MFCVTDAVLADIQCFLLSNCVYFDVSVLFCLLMYIYVWYTYIYGERHLETHLAYLHLSLTRGYSLGAPTFT